MTGFTTAGQNALLDLIDSQGWYIAPCNGDPAAAGTELSDETTEGRQALDNLAAASSGSAATGEDFTWTANLSGGSITVNHIGYYDAASGGNLVASGTVPPRTLYENGDTITFPTGEITIEMAEPAA